MSSAEMVIKLVDGTEEEQAAFDRAPTDSASPSTDSASVAGAPRQDIAAPGATASDEANKTPTDAVTTTPTIDGLDSPSFKRLLDRLEAQALAFTSKDSTTDGKTSQSAADQAAAITVGQVHEQLAEIAKGKDKAGSQADSAEGENDNPTRDDFRDLRQSMIELAQRFTPKFFAEPIERLIAALAPRDDSKKDEPAATVPPSTGSEKPAIIPAVGPIAPKQDDKTNEPKPASVGDIFAKMQERIGNVPFIGKRINNVINTTKAQFKNVKAKITKAGTQAKNALTKTRTGRALMAQASKVGSFAKRAGARIASSKVGKAVASVAQSAIGAVARTVGTTAAGGAVASGGAGGVAASGGATAAGGVAAAALANPVGLAVGAVVASFAALAVGAKLLNDTFAAEADRLEQYSASISISRAKRQMNTELNMQERASRIGGATGSLEASKAGLSNMLEKLYTDLLGALSSFTPYLAKGIDFLTIMAGEVAKTNAAIAHQTAQDEVIAAKKTPGMQDDIDALKKVIRTGNALDGIKKEIEEAADRFSGQSTGRDPQLMDMLLKVQFDANGRLI